MQRVTEIATVRNANNNGGKLTHHATQAGSAFGNATSSGDLHNHKFGCRKKTIPGNKVKSQFNYTNSVYGIVFERVTVADKLFHPLKHRGNNMHHLL
jgi:hypothetical protein